MGEGLCGLGDENLTISLRLYLDNDGAAGTEYGQKITELSTDSFRWMSIDRRTDKRKSYQGKLSYGIVHVTIRANGDLKRKG